MKIFPLQASFAAGEISPLMRSNPRLKGYQEGVARMRNMFPDPRGPAVARGGMQHIGRLAGNDARVVSIQIDEGEYYIALFTDLDLSINTTQGVLPGNNLISNPSFENGGTDWTTRISQGSTVNYSANNTVCSPYLPSASLVTNSDFQSLGLGWTVRTSQVQSTVVFTDGLCTLTPRNSLGDYSGIAQPVTTAMAGRQHTIIINRENTSSDLELSIGVLEGNTDYLSQTVPGGIGQIEYTFTPLIDEFWITLDCISAGNNEVAYVSLFDVAEPTDGHFAGIAQGVTTTQVGQVHFVNVSAKPQSGQAYSLKIGTAEDDGTYIETQVGVDHYEVQITPTVADIWITLQGNYPDVNPSFSINTVSINEPGGGDDVVRFDTPYLEEDLEELQFVQAPSTGATYLLHQKYPPYKITYNDTTKAWTFELVVFASQPAAWGADNYPVTGAVFQGRLWLAGPQETIWGSVSASYEDFNIGTGALQDEAQEFTLNAYGRIRWVAGLKNLLIGTENAEHIVDSQGPVIYSADLQIEQQSSYGSAKIQPVQVGDQIFYVSPDRMKLRAMQYEWTANNWLSKDLTFTSEHITGGFIKSMTWAQNPNNILFLVLRNCDMTTLRYERGSSGEAGQEIFGWSLMQSQNRFIDLTSGTYFGENEVVGITQHNTGELDLEYAAFDDEIFMDSWIEQYYWIETTTVAGLDHLNDRLVQVITDDAVHPDRIVKSGQIELQWDANHVIVGLGFNKTIETLPIDAGAPNGSAMSWRKGWNKVYVRLIDSAIPTINGTRPPTRHPVTPMDTPEPGTTQDVSVLELGWNQYAKNIVEQDLQLGLIVSAIYGEMNQESI